jgi:hypothetical protein
VPLGKSTPLHTHAREGVSVRISNAEMAEEFADGTKEEFEARFGQTAFGTGPEISHKVINRGKTDFRNIYIELLPARGSLHR